MERHQVAEIFLADRSTNRFNTYLWSLFLHTLTESALHKCVFEHYTTCMSDLVSKLLGTYMIVSQRQKGAGSRCLRVCGTRHKAPYAPAITHNNTCMEQRTHPNSDSIGVYTCAFFFMHDNNEDRMLAKTTYILAQLYRRPAHRLAVGSNSSFPTTTPPAPRFKCVWECSACLILH